MACQDLQHVHIRLFVTAALLFAGICGPATSQAGEPVYFERATEASWVKDAPVEHTLQDVADTTVSAAGSPLIIPYNAFLEALSDNPQSFPSDLQTIFDDYYNGVLSQQLGAGDVAGVSGALHGGQSFTGNLFLVPLDPHKSPGYAEVESRRYLLYRGNLSGEADWVGKSVQVHSASEPINNPSEACCNTELDCEETIPGGWDGPCDPEGPNPEYMCPDPTVHMGDAKFIRTDNYVAPEPGQEQPTAFVLDFNPERKTVCDICKTAQFICPGDLGWSGNGDWSERQGLAGCTNNIDPACFAVDFDMMSSVPKDCDGPLPGVDVGRAARDCSGYGMTTGSPYPMSSFNANKVRSSDQCGLPEQCLYFGGAAGSVPDHCDPDLIDVGTPYTASIGCNEAVWGNIPGSNPDLICTGRDGFCTNEGDGIHACVECSPDGDGCAPYKKYGWTDPRWVMDDDDDDSGSDGGTTDSESDPVDMEDMNIVSDLDAQDGTGGPDGVDSSSDVDDPKPTNPPGPNYAVQEPAPVESPSKNRPVDDTGPPAPLEHDKIGPPEITRIARNNGRPGGGAPSGAGGGDGPGGGRRPDARLVNNEKTEDGGDPVLLQNGSFDMNVTDLSFPGTGGTGLAFRRRYNSASGERGSLGSNWQHNFESYLQFIHEHNAPNWVPDFCTAAMPMTTCIIHHGGSGGSQLFIYDRRTDVYTPQAGSTLTLRKVEPVDDELDTEWMMRSPDGIVWQFNQYGYLIGRHDRFGNGYRIDYELDPMYATRRRYCTPEAFKRFYGTDLSDYGELSRLCIGLARAGFGAWEVENEQGLPAAWGRGEMKVPGEMSSTIEDYENDLSFDTNYPDKVQSDARIYLALIPNGQELFQLPAGGRKLRPVKVTDNLGRTLNFNYDEDPATDGEPSPTYGLLTRVDGPNGSHVEFTYETPPLGPDELNEAFLTQIEREAAATMGGRSRTIDYSYQWSNETWPTTAADTMTVSGYATKIDTYYSGYYSSFTQCTSEPVPEICGASVSAVRKGGPCRYAKFMRYNYRSSIQDNIVRVTRNAGYPSEKVVEVESAYRIDPWAMDFDHVVTQRYGGEPDPNRSAGDGWLTAYPEFSFEYVDAGPIDGSGVSRTSGLPEAIKDRYKPETVPDGVSIETKADIPAPNSGPEAESIYECEGVTTDACDDPYREDMATLLPTWHPHYEYYEAESAESVDQRHELKRSRLTCQQLARRQTLDPLHNDTMLTETVVKGSQTTPDDDFTGTRLFWYDPAVCTDEWAPSDHPLDGYVKNNCMKWEHRMKCTSSRDIRDGLWKQMKSSRCAAEMLAEYDDQGLTVDTDVQTDSLTINVNFDTNHREFISRNNKRICRWVKTTDRDDRVQYYGLNYRGQVLVHAREKWNGSTSEFLFGEQLFNADGKLVKLRETVDEGIPQRNTDYTAYSYPELSDDDAEIEDHPGFWARRGNLLSQTFHPDSPVSIKRDDGSAGAFDYRRHTFTYEPLFNQVSSAETTVHYTGDSAPTSLARREVIFDYQEFSSGSEILEAMLIASLRWGMEWPTKLDADDTLGIDWSDSDFSAMFEPTLYGNDQNGDGKPTTVAEARDRAIGVPVKVTTYGKNSTNPRETLYQWAPNGQPKRVDQPSGPVATFEYYPSMKDVSQKSSDFWGDGTDTSDSLADPDYSGLLAARTVTRADLDYSTDIDNDTELSNLFGAPCRSDLGPYAWLAGDGCQTSLVDMKLPISVTSEIEEVATDNDTTTVISYGPTGHSTEIWQNGKKHTFTRDNDGRVHTYLAPNDTQATTSYTLDGDPYFVDVSHVSSGELVGQTKRRFDDAGNLTAECRALTSGGCGAKDTSIPTTRDLNAPIDYQLAQLNYTHEGLLASRTDPRGVTTQYDYHLNRPLLESRETGAQHASVDHPARNYFIYDDKGRLTQRLTGVTTNSPGVGVIEESFGYDALGRLVSRTDSGALEWQMAHDARDNLRSRRFVHQSLGVTNEGVAFDYNAHGELIRKTRGMLTPSGKKVQTDYLRTDGGRIGAIDRDGQGEVLTTFDNAGRPAWQQRPDGSVTIWTREPDDRRATRAVVRKDEDGEFWTRSAMVDTDVNGQPHTRMIWGKHGGETLTKNHSWDLDFLGRADSYTRPDGRITKHVGRNLAGWVSQQETQTPSGWDVTTFEHNPNGRVVRETDASGQSTTYTYSGLGRLTAVDKPGTSAPSEWDYDRLGRVDLRLIPGDNLGQVSLGQHVLDYSYQGSAGQFDTTGRVTRIDWTTAPSSISNPTILTQSWDNKGRLTGDQRFNLKVLTVNSNLTRTDVRIKRSFTYDVLGYVTEAGRTVGDTAQFGQRKVMANTMLTSGNDAWLRSVTYPWADLPGSQIRSRSWVDQEFDKSGRLAGIIGETGPEQFNVEFDWRGSNYLGRSQAWSNSADPLESSRQFDALGRPLRWTYRTVDLDTQGNPTWTSWADSYCGGTWRSDCADPLLQIDVVRDKIGRIGSLQWAFGHPFVDSQGQVNTSLGHDEPWRGYKYDIRGALTGVWEHAGDQTVVDGSELWSHNHSLTGSDVDSLGSGHSGATEWNWVRDSKVASLYAITPESEGMPDRWKSTTSSPVGGTSRGPGHQLESVKVDQTNYTLGHDEAGRTATAFGMTMTWGPQGRLKAVSDANGLIEAYLYDAGGRLTAIMDQNGVKKTFVYDGDQIVAAFDGSGNSLWEAVWGARQDQLVLWQDIAGGDDGYIPLTDHRRSIVGTWSKNGERMDELARYTPQGRVTRKDYDESNLCQERGNPGTVCSGPSGMPFGFNSMWRSEETGFVYMRNRWYVPRLGQFLSHDPLGYVDSHNPYAFVAFDPINGWDPYGLERGGFVRKQTPMDRFVNWLVSFSKPDGTGERKLDKSMKKINKPIKQSKERVTDLKEKTDSWVKWFAYHRMQSYLEGIDLLVPDNGDEAMLDIALSVGSVGLKLSGAIGKAITKGDDLAGLAKKTCSFTAATKVRMCGGAYKPIAEVEAGDRVLSKDAETGEVDCRTVRNPYFEVKPVAEVTLEADDGTTETIESTTSHPFWIRGDGWVKVGEMQPGTEVLTARGESMLVTRIAFTTRTERVYNFGVQDFRSYFVGESGVWVHNCYTPKGPMKGKKIGHTYSKHGRHNTKELTLQAKNSGISQGQWLDEAQAEKIISNNLDKLHQGAVTVDIPAGVGRVVKPDGSFAPASKARLVPSGSGVKTAYPVE